MINILTIIPSIPHDKQGHFIAGIVAYTLIHFFNPIIALFVVLVMAMGKARTLASTVSTGGPLEDGVPADIQEFTSSGTFVMVELWGAGGDRYQNKQ